VKELMATLLLFVAPLVAAGENYKCTVTSAQVLSNSGELIVSPYAKGGYLDSEFIVDGAPVA